MGFKFLHSTSRYTKLLTGTILLIGLAVIVFMVINLMTPRFMTSITRQLFSQTEYPSGDDYGTVGQHLDLSYGSDPLEELDILYPQTNDKQLPIIFWVHGGGFIGGDKSSTRGYMKMLAAKGYVVSSINYSLAPDSHYPTPINQLSEAYKFVMRHADSYNIDPNQVIFGGDSAGAQIALQFVNIQTNSDYSKQVDIKPVVPADTIKAAISLSGLLDLERFTQTDSPASNYTYYRAGWSYFNDRDWQTSPDAKQASVVGNTSPNFPPTFITDGNTNSFEDQARDLVDELSDNNIPVTSKFYSRSDTILGHEYQFDMDKPESNEVFDSLVSFLNKL